MAAGTVETDVDVQFVDDDAEEAITAGKLPDDKTYYASCSWYGGVATGALDASYLTVYI